MEGDRKGSGLGEGLRREGMGGFRKGGAEAGRCSGEVGAQEGRGLEGMDRRSPVRAYVHTRMHTHTLTRLFLA